MRFPSLASEIRIELHLERSLSQPARSYIIPARIAQMFLNEYESTKKWAGISETGIRSSSLESAAMRSSAAAILATAGRGAGGEQVFRRVALTALRHLQSRFALSV